MSLANVFCEKGRRRIQQHYGTLDFITVTTEAAARRTGSAHAEIIVGGQSVCPVCGPIDNFEVDPDWHPEQFL